MPSVACRLEFHLKAERRGAFRHPEACPCHPLRILTLASMAVRCVGSAVAETSVVLPLAVAVSAEATALVAALAGAAIVSVAAEATATGKGTPVSNALARFRKGVPLPARFLQSRRLLAKPGCQASPRARGRRIEPC